MTAPTASRLDLAARVADLEAENARLRAENTELRDRIDFLTSAWWDTCEVPAPPTSKETLL